MPPIKGKTVKQGLIAVAFLAVCFYFIPWLLLFYMACGLADILRNEKRDWYLWQRYFSGNGFTTWLVSPLNLFIDLICYRNPKIYSLSDFSDEARRELDTVLKTFDTNRDAIMDRINRDLGDAKRGMFLFRWFGHQHNESIEALNAPFRHVRTIAVSVFDGQERTNFHFGPMRMTVRVLYNLTPVPDRDVFIETGHTRHYWADDPLFIFDDTLMHRSINDDDGRRFCVFLDVMRPSPFPGLLRAMMTPVSLVAGAFKSIYYRRWKMLGMDGA